MSVAGCGKTRQPESETQLHSPDRYRELISELLRKVRDLIPAMRARAVALDRESAFPALEFDQLRSAGALSAVIPRHLKGLGLGVDAASAPALFDLLRLLGRGNLAIGRVFEGHVNAFKLITLYGNEQQIQRAADDVAAGHLFAIWNTETGEGIRLLEGASATLAGSKMFCSGAGYVTRALITAKDTTGTRMLLIPLEPGARVEANSFNLHGMRATRTGVVTFDGIRVSSSAAIGLADDYTREPAFTAGAWRTSAVTLGGLDSLIEETQRQLISRNRHRDPHQLSRMGQALIARESVRLWTQRAARIAEAGAAPVAEITGYVNLSRIATESAALDIVRLVQRTLGLAGFLQSNPVERLMRDLAIYLRQPAPDEALTEAATWFFEHDLPEDNDD